MSSPKISTVAVARLGIFGPVSPSGYMLLGMNRRDFLKASAASALLTDRAIRAWGASDMAQEILEYQKPVFNLHKFFATPVKIASIELLQVRNQFFLRTRSADGAEGIVQTK